MTPYEIMLSESQERMLIIAKQRPGRGVREIFEKWDVPWAEIGRVTDDGMMRVRNNGRVAAEIPAKPLADEAPLYRVKRRRQPRTEPLDLATRFPEIDITERSSLQLLCAIRRSRRRTGFIANTITWSAPARSFGPGSDAAVFHRARGEQDSRRDHRLQLALLRARSARRRPHRGRGSGAQSHLLRRDAARGDGQSQLRQSL